MYISTLRCEQDLLHIGVFFFPDPLLVAISIVTITSGLTLSYLDTSSRSLQLPLSHSNSAAFYQSMNRIHFATPDVTFRTSYTWNIHRYTLEKPAVIRLTEPSVGSFALEVLVAGEPDDYFVFYEKVCAEWDCIRMVETLTFAWSLNSSSSIRYELTFKDGADFWCFLWHLTKPLPHN
ncbi:hypothetical protein EDB89DRAFT_1992859 [Lactarius sanguifluus]|nr:hypothetical protein EDB89DRAFT_1992859 [Lactarius sanguifluus]